MNSFMVYAPTKLVFGVDSLKKLHEQVLPGKKALVVISNGRSVRKNGYLDSLVAELESAKKEYVIFDKIESNPTKDAVMNGAAFARENNCDFVVALGGGSVMDASKAIAAMATNPGDLWDYVYGGTGKAQPLSAAPLPNICITTSAGTGSEVDPWGVVSNLDTQEKIGFGGDPRLFPTIAIVDPRLMLTVPKTFTAYQGFDALFHSLEGYISLAASDISDMYAAQAISAIGANLARVVNNLGDLEGRSKIAYANTMSGYVMVVGGVTSEHSIEHAMSAFHHDLPHGAGLIMISYAYFKHFVDAHSSDDRFVKMAQLLGNKEASKPEDFLTGLKQLQEACGVANLKMSDFGIKPEEFEGIAKNALETMGGLFTLDRVQIGVDDIVEILKESYK